MQSSEPVLGNREKFVPFQIICNTRKYKTGSIEIGLYLIDSIDGPDFESGNTFACFHPVMNLPDFRERLRMNANGCDMTGAAAHRSLPDSLSRSTYLFHVP